MATAKKPTLVHATPVAKKPEYALPADNPVYPPIASREQSLLAVYPADLIVWAKGLNVKVETREEALEAILRSEYGDKAFEAWAKKE